MASFPYPSILQDCYIPKTRFSESELEKELLVTPAHLLNIDLNHIEPTNVCIYDTEEQIKTVYGTYTYTFPSELLLYYEKVPEYTRVEWIKTMNFPCGKFQIVKFKEGSYCELEYMVCQLNSHPLLMFFPPNFTHKSIVRMLITTKPFNPSNAILLCLRLFTEQTSTKWSTNQTIKLWRGDFCTSHDYIGLHCLSNILCYNPLKDIDY